MALTRPTGNLIKPETISSDNIADGTVTASKLGVTPAAAGDLDYTLEVLYPLGVSASSGEVVTVTGNGFVPGSTIHVSGQPAAITTYVDSSTITFTAPDLPPGSYSGYIIQPNGSFIIIPSITYA